MLHTQYAKILWVQDEYEGPMNGFAEYNGEKLWFTRVGTPSIILSTDNLFQSIEQKNERKYLLYRLNNVDMVSLTENHKLHCEKTGSPFKHGYPIKITKKYDIVETNSTSVENKEIKFKPLGKVKIFKHKILPEKMHGTFVAIIDESNFINYLVPHRVEIII